MGGSYKKYSLTDFAGNDDYDEALLLLEAVENATVTPGVDTILSGMLTELTDATCEDSFVISATTMIARRAADVQFAWDSVGVPVSVTCDPDFEESVVRDAVKVAKPPTRSGGDDTSCPPPLKTPGSLQSLFLNRKVPSF